MVRGLTASAVRATSKRKTTSSAAVVKAGALARPGSKAAAGPSKVGKQKFSLDASGSVRVGSCGGTNKLAMQTLSTLQSEAINEIVAELLKNRYNIFVTNRIVFNENYYKDEAKASAMWLHHTLIRLAGIPKSEWIIILTEWRTAMKLKEWPEPLIRLMDKAYGLAGIAHMVCYLGMMTMEDHLPIYCGFRPILRATFTKHFMSQGDPIKNIQINPKTGLVEWDIYVFFDVDKATKKVGSIMCTRNSCQINIPRDYNVFADSWSIADAWSFTDAKIVGEITEKNILDLSILAGKESHFAYDADCFLDNTACDVKKKLDREYSDETAAMTPELREKYTVNKQ